MLFEHFHFLLIEFFVRSEYFLGLLLTYKDFLEIFVLALDLNLSRSCKCYHRKCASRCNLGGFIIYV